MAAYAGLLSLMSIIDEIKCHPSPPIFLQQKQVQSLTEKLNFLLEFLEGDEVDALHVRCNVCSGRCDRVVYS